MWLRCCNWGGSRLGLPNGMSVIPVTFPWKSAALESFAVYVTDDGTNPVSTTNVSYSWSYTVPIAAAGKYVIRAAADNAGSYSIDGGAAVSVASFDKDNLDPVDLTAGNHTITVSVLNTPSGTDDWATNPGGVALAIYRVRA